MTNRSLRLFIRDWLNTGPLTPESLKGRIVVLEFWATWCPPCRQSIPRLIRLHEAYKDRGVTIVSVTDEPRKVVEPFAAGQGMVYPIGIDDGGKTAEAYGIGGIPHAIVYDRDGTLAWEGHPLGGLDEAVEELAG